MDHEGDSTLAIAAGSLADGDGGRPPILVVDDSPSGRATLAGLLRSWGHEVVEAADGDEAWARLRDQPVPLVITDWVMPGLSGIDLVARIRESVARPYTYVILLTAKTGGDDCVEAFDSGADDYLSKPFDAAELRARIRAGERILRLQADLARNNGLLSAYNESLRKAHATLRRDLLAAARVQRRLLLDTPCRIDGWLFDALFVPSSYVAGDLFNAFHVDSGRMTFYHVDVAGHGVTAALLSAALSRSLSAMRTAPLSADAPGAAARFTERLNRTFVDELDECWHFTMALGVLDTRTGSGELTQAGHPPPIHVGRGLPARLVGDGGFPIGLLPEAHFEGTPIELGPGDRFVLYSDGVTDCLGPHDEPYGVSRLLTCLDDTRALELPAALAVLEGQLRAWHGPGDFADDVSVLAVQAPPDLPRRRVTT